MPSILLVGIIFIIDLLLDEMKKKDKNGVDGI
jgi:hypothetical protein